MLYGSILKTTRHIKGCRQAERRFDGNARDVPPDSCSSWDSKTKTALKGEDRLGRENVSHSGKGTDRKQQVMRSVVDPLLGCQRELNSWDVPSQNRTEKTHEKITMQIGFFFFFSLKELLLWQSKEKPDWLSSAKNYLSQKWHFHGILKWIAAQKVVCLLISLSVCLLFAYL